MNTYAKTYFVWTEKGIIPHPEERQIGQQVYEYYCTCCPRSWVEKGYVVDSTDYPPPE